MKNYKEIADNVLSRRDKYDEEQIAKKKKMIRISSIVSCFVVVGVLGIGFWKGGWIDFNSLSLANPSSQEGNNVESTHNNYQESSTIMNSTQDQTVTQAIIPSKEQSTSGYNSETPPAGGSFSDGGVGSLWCIPALPFDRSIALTGEAITDKEAKAYFEINGNSIISSLASSGTPVDNIKISEKGYSHVYYDGTEGKSFEIRQNYRDYLVYNGDKLIAIITLFKENGEIYNTPMFGAKWFDDYGKYLEEHKEEKLVYVYASFYEIIIAPDNTYFNPMGIDDNSLGMDITGIYLDGVENPYDMFYHELATYIP